MSNILRSKACSAGQGWFDGSWMGWKCAVMYYSESVEEEKTEEGLGSSRGMEHARATRQEQEDVCIIHIPYGGPWWLRGMWMVVCGLVEAL
jgi:hypothetical protein